MPGQSGVGYSYLYNVQTGTLRRFLVLANAQPDHGGRGQDITGTVTLSGPAPSGGGSCLPDQRQYRRGPRSRKVTVGAGKSTASFTATTYAVTTATSVTLAGSYCRE